MKLIEFISLIQSSPEKLHDYPKIQFTGQNYPLLFFSYATTALNKKQPGLMTIIDPTLQDETYIKAQLQTSFLGIKRLFWFGSLAALDASAQKRWEGFLYEYNGPNTILFFSEEKHETKSKTLELMVPASIDKKLFQAIVTLIGLSASDEFIRSLYDRVQSLSLENACLLAQYAGLIGSKQYDFFDLWFDKLIVSDSSLFTLSQYFFAQDAHAFFGYWANIRGAFSEPFWITFWSEQLFRAHAFVRFMKQGKRAEANRISYKLPFSFMQRDWKQYQPDALQSAHNLLYQVDYQLKNGGSAYGLDLFYAHFFLEHQK